MKTTHAPLLALVLSVIAQAVLFAAPPKGKALPPPPPKPVAELDTWISLCSLRPSTELQAALLARPADAGSPPWHALKLETGSGPLMLDQRSLLVTRMPLVDNQPMTAPAMLEYVRKHFAEMLAPAATTAGPVSDADRTLWDSDKPVGAVLQAASSAGGKMAFVVSDTETDSFTLSVIHPGTREYSAPSVVWQRRISVQEATPFEGCILSVKAVARAAGENVTPEQVQAGLGSTLWNALLTNVASFVQKNGGAAESTLLPAVTTTASWDGVQAKFHQPKNNWLDIEGVWQSTDPGRRFRLEVKGWTGTCDFIERNSRGIELRMTLPLRAEAGDKPGSLKFIIERPNDRKEVLDYFSFSDALQTEILAKFPKPSIMVITRAGKKLNGEWSGISISRDAYGKHLKEFKQPAEMKPKLFPFADAATLPPPVAPKPAATAAPRALPVTDLPK